MTRIGPFPPKITKMQARPVRESSIGLSRRTVEQHALSFVGIGDPRIFMGVSYQSEFDNARNLLLEKISHYPQKSRKTIKKACAIMEAALGQYLKGELVFQKYRLAAGLAELDLGPHMIAASLLFELPTEAHQISDPKIAKTVEQLNRARSIHYGESSRGENEIFANFLISEFSLDALLILAMDKLVALNSVLGDQTGEGIKVRRELALKAFDVLAIILRRLRFREMGEKLEDAALHYLEPEEYQEVLNKINQKIRLNYFKAKKKYEKLGAEAREFLISQNIPFISPSPWVRVKPIPSVKGKMKQKNDANLKKIHDLIAMRWLAVDRAACYALEDPLTAFFEARGWKKVEAERNDYIRFPKKNKKGRFYRSLHLTFKKGRVHIEVQIRTPVMDFQAHFDGYKDRITLPPDVITPPSPQKIYQIWKDSLRGRVYAFSPDRHAYELIPFPKDQRPSLLDLAAASGVPLTSPFRVYKSREKREVDPFEEVVSGESYRFEQIAEAGPDVGEWQAKARKHVFTLKGRLELLGNPEAYPKQGAELIETMFRKAQSDLFPDIFEKMEKGDIEMHTAMFMNLIGIAHSMGLDSEEALYAAMAMFKDSMPSLRQEVGGKISKTLFISGENPARNEQISFWMILPDHPELFLNILKLLRDSSLDLLTINLRRSKSGNYLIEIMMPHSHKDNFSQFKKHLRQTQENLRFFDREYEDKGLRINIRSSDAESTLTALEKLAASGLKITSIATPPSETHNLSVVFRMPSGYNHRKLISTVRRELRAIAGLELISPAASAIKP